MINFFKFLCFRKLYFFSYTSYHRQLPFLLCGYLKITWPVLPIRSGQFIFGQRFLLVLILHNKCSTLCSKRLNIVTISVLQKAQISPGANVLGLDSATWRTFANIWLVHCPACFCWLLKKIKPQKKQPARAVRGPLIPSFLLANGHKPTQ